MKFDIYEVHPELRKFFSEHPNVKVYKIYDSDGKISEQYEKNSRGEWIDVTEREKLREQIQEEMNTLAKLNELEAKRKKKQLQKMEETSDEEEPWE